MSTSKCIGNTFERRVGALFSTALGGTWVRVPNSGAYVGGKNCHRRQNLDEDRLTLFSADLIPPKGWENVIVECKKRAKIEFRQFADINGSKLLNEWIDQVYSDNKEFLPETKSRLIVFAPKFGGMYVTYHTPLRHQVPEQWNHIEYWYNTKHYGIKCFVIHELTISVLRKMFHAQHMKWLLEQEVKPMSAVNQPNPPVMYISTPSDNPLISMFNTTIQELPK